MSRACLRRCFGFVTRRRATLHSGVVLGISRNRPTRQLVSNGTHCVDTGAAPKALPMAPPKRKCFTKQRLGKHLRKTENEALGGKKKKTRPSGRGAPATAAKSRVCVRICVPGNLRKSCGYTLGGPHTTDSCRTCTTSRPPTHVGHRVSPVSREKKFVSSPFSGSFPRTCSCLPHGVKYVALQSVAIHRRSWGSEASSWQVRREGGGQGQGERTPAPGVPRFNLETRRRESFSRWRTLETRDAERAVRRVREENFGYRVRGVFPQHVP